MQSYAGVWVVVVARNLLSWMKGDDARSLSSPSLDDSHHFSPAIHLVVLVGAILVPICIALGPLLGVPTSITPWSCDVGQLPATPAQAVCPSSPLLSVYQVRDGTPNLVGSIVHKSPCTCLPQEREVSLHWQTMLATVAMSTTVLSLECFPSPTRHLCRGFIGLRPICAKALQAHTGLKSCEFYISHGAQNF